jgi:predicted dienelactone hydrolase
MNRLALLALLSLAFGTSLAGSYDDKKGSFNDESRDRKIPYKIYYPKPLEGRYPVIIVSHGLGDSREGNTQLGRRLAENGFIAIHIEHPGSDDSVTQGARDRRSAREAARRSLSIDTALARFQDVPFVVTALAKLDADDKQLKGHLNLEALGMAGHSYGAIGTMVAAGERLTPRYLSFKVPQIRAGLLLSPSPLRAQLDPAKAYADISIPLFHITGTRDDALLEGRNVVAADRVRPYQLLHAPKQYLLVLNGADHVASSGHRIGTHDEQPLDGKHMESILTGAVAFFQAYLANQPDKEEWLQKEYKKQLADGDMFEFK